ncbi:MAG: hypothetical protein WC753_04425 [Candidatus Gracilibacteria bacterium]
MKIILSLLLLFSLSMVFSATTLTVEEKFNKAYEDSLKNRWEKPQEGSELSLFDKARKEVQNVKNMPKDMKPTERIYTIMATFCEPPYSSCNDATSLSSQLKAGCATARDDAIAIMQENDIGFANNNTELLVSSYTDCITELAPKVLDAFRASALDEMTTGVADLAKESNATFLEKVNNQFQEKVGNIWDIFTKKMTNFVRSIQGFTKNLYQ